MEAPPPDDECYETSACTWPAVLSLRRIIILAFALGIAAAAAAAAVFSLRPAASAGAVAAAAPSLPGDPNCPQMAGMVMPCPGAPANGTDPAPH
jgi:hypothetical protein